MKNYPFFALLKRLKLIRRWSLMHSVRTENVCEHSFEVAILAHNLACLRKLDPQGRPCPDPEHVLTLGLFHDAAECLTGDLPTPIKYANETLRQAFHSIEKEAEEALLQGLPSVLHPAYAPLLGLSNQHDISKNSESSAVLETEAWRLVKAADKLSAFLKCSEECALNNQEFSRAQEETWHALQALEIPEVEVFLQYFQSSYGLCLDDLRGGINQ